MKEIESKAKWPKITYNRWSTIIEAALKETGQDYMSDKEMVKRFTNKRNQNIDTLMY